MEGRLKIIQINLHHSKLACCCLTNYMLKEDISVALIQEPWLNGQGSITGLRSQNYNMFFKRGNNKTRSCILVKKGITSFLLDKFSDDDTVSVLVEGVGETEICLVSAYLPFDRSDVVGSALESLIRSKKWDLLIGGDVNAHHTQWGSSDINLRGEELLEFILMNNLRICNIGKTPTFVIKNREEVLDITLVSNNCNINVYKWKVLEEDSMSDHKWITYELEFKAVQCKPFMNIRRANWNTFVDTFKSKIDGFSSEIKCPNQLEESVNSLTSILNESIKRACPNMNRKNKKEQPPWWNSELEKLMKETRKLYSLAHSKNPKKSALEKEQALGVYKENKRILKNKIRKSKRESWMKFTSSIENGNEATRLRKVLSKETFLPTFIKKEDGEYAESTKDVLSTLLFTHFPGCSEVQNLAYEGKNSSVVSSIITEGDVKWAINSFKPYKTPGPDSIYPIMIQKIQDEIAPILKSIYEACLRFSYVPLSWRRVNVTFIPKPGRISHSTAKDFRPISLSSFLLKGMERILDTEIRNSLDPTFISANQHAYIKGKSVETALHKVIKEIEHGMNCKEYTLAAFLDIEGAFNNVKADSIRKGLIRADVPVCTIQWIMEMLTSRIVKAEMGNCSIEKAVKRGTPQGGVISPLLWLLVINDLIRKLESMGVSVTAYADDAVITTKGKDLNTLSELIENAMSVICDWAKENGLGINPEKTELVLFTRKYKIETFRLPMIGDTQLKLSDRAKFLGIILDSKLNWKLNVDERIKKAYNALYACNKVIGKKWGLRPDMIYWIYQTVVIPVLTYGSLVWWPVVKKKYMITKLQKVQRTACLCITGALRSTSTEALEAILCLLPIDANIKSVASRSAIRLNCIGLFKTNVWSHSSILLESHSLGIGTDDLDMIMTLNVTEPKFQLVYPSREDWSNDSILNESEISVFTDGSKMESGTGAGFFCDQLNISKSFRLPELCSVYQSEVLAVKKAAEQLLIEQVSDRDISFYIDNQAAITSIGSRTIKSSLVRDCREVLDALCSQNRIRLCWVPGHSDIKGNEFADELARKGSEDTSMEETEIKVPYIVIKSKLKEKVEKQMKDSWETTTTSQTARQLWTSIDKSKTNQLLHFSKTKIREVIGGVTGHCLLGAHAFKMGLRNSDECRFCFGIDAREDIRHVLCECPGLMKTRKRTLGEYFFEDLEDVSKVDLSHFWNFVNIIGIFGNK